MEKLELVTDFMTLKSGMVVVHFCGFCAGRHRHILISHYVGPSISPNGIRAIREGWIVLPVPKCEKRKSRLLTVSSVNKRTVYRVVDGLGRQMEKLKSEQA